MCARFNDALHRTLRNNWAPNESVALAVPACNHGELGILQVCMPLSLVTMASDLSFSSILHYSVTSIHLKLWMKLFVAHKVKRSDQFKQCPKYVEFQQCFALVRRTRRLIAVAFVAHFIFAYAKRREIITKRQQELMNPHKWGNKSLILLGCSSHSFREGRRVRVYRRRTRGVRLICRLNRRHRRRDAFRHGRRQRHLPRSRKKSGSFFFLFFTCAFRVDLASTPDNSIIGVARRRHRAAAV